MIPEALDVLKLLRVPSSLLQGWPNKLSASFPLILLANIDKSDTLH